MQTAFTGQRTLHPHTEGRREPRASAHDTAPGHTTESNSLESLERALVESAAAKDTLRAVCAHITASEGTESSRALAGLVRALYLDASTFTFESLDCLGPVTRRHAEHMISARLWNTWAEEEWQKAFAAVSAYEFKEATSTLVDARAPAGSASAASVSDAGAKVEHLEGVARLRASSPSGTRRAAGPEGGGRESGSTSREWLARFVVLILFLLMAAAFVLHIA